MKKFPLTFLILLTVSAMRSCAQSGSTQSPATQSLPARWSISLAAGPAFPVGNFHRSPAGVDGSGGSGVNSGGSVELNGALRIWRALSVTVVVEGQENKGYGMPYVTVSPGDENAAGPRKGNDWKVARILAGAVYSWPLTKRAGPAIMIRLIGGLQRTISADSKYEVFYIGPQSTAPPPYITYPGVTFPWCFGYEADAGLQWRFHGRFSAIGYIGLQGAKPSATKAYAHSLNLPPDEYIPIYFGSSYATTTISLRAGVSYDLSR